MTKENVTMSYTEIDRLKVIQKVVDKRLKQKDATAALKLSIRQVKRLVRAYNTEGATGLVSKRRGIRPNNAIDDAVRKQAIKLINDKYSDFGPTFAHEKLTENHAMSFSVETLRQWMIQAGLWQTKSCKKARIHQSRPRRSREGELVQIDGSPHDWFEGRAPTCTLIVFIDDATSKLLVLLFVPTETTQAYMQALKNHLDKYGRAVAYYSDKHSIFRVNMPDKNGELTQFSRALKTLDIEPIHANTPQAKGRVERANQTLQDRLVKEMRLAGINNIEQANQFLPAFIEDYNQRFAVEPSIDDDAHRKVLHSDEELELILSKHYQRKLSKNLTIQFNNTQYQLQGYGNGYRLRGAAITICQAFDGSITLMYNGKTLEYKLRQQGATPIPVVDEKTIQHEVDKTQIRQQKNPAYKPAPDHPWHQPLRY